MTIRENVTTLYIIIICELMNVLYPELNQDYHETTKIASQLLDTPYEGDVIFHCYWSGKLNKNLLLSLKSCYYFNIMGRMHPSILL